MRLVSGRVRRPPLAPLQGHEGQQHVSWSGSLLVCLTPQRTSMRSLRGDFLLLLLLLLVPLGQVTSALKVLGIFPNAALSHQLVYQELMKAMVARGHSVTVVSSSPLKEPLENYTDVDTSVAQEDFQDLMDLTQWETQNSGTTLRVANDLSLEMCRGVFLSSQVQRFIRSGESGFDLALVEFMNTPCVNGLVHHVGSPPMAAILSFMAVPHMHWQMGAHYNPAHMSHLLSPESSDSMTFWERAFNSLTWVGIIAVYEQLMLPANEDFQRRIFGEAPLPLSESDTNYSVLLQHHHWSLGYPQPLTPNMVQLRGMHLKDHAQPLPQDVEAFMEGAGDHGVVYCSFGSLFNTDDLTEDQVELMMAAFEAIPQRVLWKWNSRPLPRNISNVFTSKWFPQQDILADSRVRLFVTQGGVQSLQEAVNRQVPLLGVPFMHEQKYNINAMKVRGVALSLTLRETTAEAMAAAIQELIRDSGYRDAMTRLARVYEDREGSRSSVDTAVFWLEYAVRHRGAPHLRSAALELHWTQALLLDVGVVVALALGLVVQGLRHRASRLPCLAICLLLLLWCCFFC